MVKKLTTEEILQIENDLQDNKSAKRKNASKKIRKYKLYELGDALYKAYIEEYNDIRTWETQEEMILALGYIDYKKSLPEIQKRISSLDRNVAVSARTYVRLKRENLNDIEPILELVKSDNPQLIGGATSVLTFDNMTPSDEDIKKLISIFDQKYKDDVFVPQGTTDPRIYLMSAMSRWNKLICETYIMRFLNSSNYYLKKSAELAFKGKKSPYGE